MSSILDWVTHIHTDSNLLRKPLNKCESIQLPFTAAATAYRTCTPTSMIQSIGCIKSMPIFRVLIDTSLSFFNVAQEPLAIRQVYWSLTWFN